MPATFWEHYLLSLTVIALILGALYGLARVVRPNALFKPKCSSIAVLESCTLSPQPALHVVKAGERYLLIGSSATGINTLAELTNYEAPNARAAIRPTSASTPSRRCAEAGEPT